LIDAGVDSVMTGHLAAPRLADDLRAPESERSMPATLSRTLTTTLLRERLGFTGVIVTDAMEMHAITKLVGDGEAAVLTILAGTDIVLMPVDPNVAFDALLTASEQGRITAEELRARIRRIWNLKQSALAQESIPDIALLRRLE